MTPISHTQPKVRFMSRLLRLIAVPALFAACSGAAAALPRVEVAPQAPAYGQDLQINLVDAAWPQYLPASRYLRSGNNIVVDYEYRLSDFGPGDPAFGYRPVPVGQIVPGNYTIQARFLDIGTPGATPQTVTSTFAVAPPSTWGMYLVPSAPGAFEAAKVLVYSAAYFDPTTLRASVSGNVIRVDFDFSTDAPVGGAAPPGLVAYAAVPIDGLAPGAYRIEGYGTPISGGTPTQYFTLDYTVGSLMPVIEYYHRGLDHYFMAGGPDEVKLLDAGVQGEWKRTGEVFKAWLRQADAPANAHPVCRFYAYGPNSHFFTGDAYECQLLKDEEATERAQAAAAGTPFLGWGYEGIGFWALTPEGGVCPAGSDPVYRVYNNRWAQGDSNHRFMFDGPLRWAMQTIGIDEGAMLCSPR